MKKGLTSKLINLLNPCFYWRRQPDLNRRITVLQTAALATWLCRLKTTKVNPVINARLTFSFSSGAGNGTRTRDNHVGNVRLYQLSYSRVNPVFLIFS